MKLTVDVGKQTSGSLWGGGWSRDLERHRGALGADKVTFLVWAVVTQGDDSLRSSSLPLTLPSEEQTGPRVLLCFI